MRVFGGAARSITLLLGIIIALTLVIVPVMYRLTTLMQKRLIVYIKLRKHNNSKKALAAIE